MFEALNVSLLASQNVTSALRGIATASDAAGDAARESSVEFGALGSALDSVDDDAIAMAVGATTAQSAIDEVGDEAVESAVELEALDVALDDTATSSVGLAGSLGPLRGRLSTIGPLAAATVPPLIGLGGALGGLATAGGAAAAGIGAIAFGGLQAEAERMAAASDEFEDSGEAMEQIMSNFGSALKDATEPLQTLQSTEFAMSGLEGVVELVREGSVAIADMRDVLVPLAENFGATSLETAPEIFDELGTAVRELSPALNGMVGAIEAVPAAIAWFREQAVALMPALGNFTWSAISAGAAVGEFGTFLMGMVLPGLAGLLGGLAIVTTAFNGLPGPVKAATIAMIAGTAAASALGITSLSASGAVSALTASLVALTAPISLTTVAIGALIGVTVGIISHFGWWDDILGTLKGTWNTVLGAIEWGVNTFFSLYDALGMLGPVLFPGIAVLTRLGDIVNWVGGVLEWLGGVASDVIGWIVDKLGTVAKVINKVIEAIDKASDAAGIDMDIESESLKKVDLSGLEAGGDGPDSSGNDSGPGKPSRPSMPERMAEPGSGSQPHYDFRGADFSGSDQSQVEKSVQEAIEQANKESRSRQDGSSV